MNDAQGGSNGLPPFITKTYEMVDDPLTDPIVSWSHGNKSFVVWNPPEFSGELLPRFFKHNNFSSFIRQLNTYGFRKVDPEQWEFANEDFVKGQPHLLKNIHRRKPVHSHSITNLSNNGSSSGPLMESEKRRFIEEIDKLRLEKESLSFELQTHKNEQERIESAARELTNRLKIAGKRQNEILSSLDKTLQKPANGCEFAPNDRKRRLSFEMKNNPFEIPISEPLTVETLLALDTELVQQLESSLMLWETILKDEGFEQQKWRFGLDNELAICADSPAICYPAMDVETGCKEREIDMNSKPVKGVATEEDNLAGNAQAGVNDVFWEQFLTENPGGSTANNVAAEVVQVGKFWWNMRSVNNLADQLGQLTPAERT